MNKQTLYSKISFMVVMGYISLYSFHTIANERNNESKVIKVFTIGDSTMADYTSFPTKAPMFGWGQVFQDYFNPEKVIIANYARSGRSCKTFISDGYWNTVLSQISAGDYVFIQFGHNDEKDSSLEEYRTNLARFIGETRKKGALPVLLTPVTRRTFNNDGTLYDSHIKDGKDYPSSMRKLAADSAVQLIDITASSMELVQSLGVEGSKIIYLWLNPGEYSNYPEGSSDNTHFSEYGANEIARLIINGLKESNSQLTTAFSDYAGTIHNIALSEEMYLFKNSLYFTHNFSNCNLRIYTVNGLLINSIQLSEVTKNIDLSFLNKGLYIVMAKINNKDITTKIILH
ncbi:MAG: GDSL-type esterase/lipase family protein [Paludibacter sp.]|nr:GDSL-type esterase/lipase family protein [Paludibacter sp.]